jgi:CubicO group peptidase (beta-lactamase class C family)
MGLALTAALALASTGGAQEPATPVDEAQEEWHAELHATGFAFGGFGSAALSTQWAGERSRHLRRLLVRGDRYALERYLREHATPDLLPEGAGPLATQLLEGAPTGDLTLWSIIGWGDDGSAALLRSLRYPDQWLRLDVGVESELPWRLASLALTPGSRVDDPHELGPLPESKLVEVLESLLEPRLGHWGHSGAVLLARQGKVVLRGAWGPAEYELGAMNEVTTQFDLASLDQMFTAVVVARLVEEGKLAFEDPIGRYLDGWVAPEVGDAVTVHHLLTHTSGLGDYREGARLLPRGEPLRDLADYKPITLADRPVFEPGSDFRESTNGYLLLGAIIEAVSGRSYEDCVHEYVHRPAMMADTGSFEADEVRGDRAVGYYLDDQKADRWGVYGSLRNNTLLRDAKGTPAGGGWSTVDDLLSFALRLQQARFVSEEMTEILLAPKVELSPGGRARSYGFEVLSTPDGGRVWGLSGETPGASALLEVHEDRGYVLVALSNVSGGAWTVGEMFRHLLMRTER